MESSKNLTIGVLSVTATILLVGLVLIHTPAPQAYAAAGASAQAGNYTLVNGQFKVDRELFYLIDAASEQLIVYRWDQKSREAFAPAQTIDLRTLRENVPQESKDPKSRGGYKRS